MPPSLLTNSARTAPVLDTHHVHRALRGERAHGQHTRSRRVVSSRAGSPAFDGGRGDRHSVAAPRSASVSRSESPMFDTAITDELLATTPRPCASDSTSTARSIPQVILECIALAQQAPTGTNAQSWRWVVVTEPATKAALAEIYRGGCLALPGAGRGRGEGPADPTGVRERAPAGADHRAGARARDPVHRASVRRRAARRHRVVVRVDPAGGVELPPRVAVARPRLGVDHRAPLERSRGGGGSSASPTP